jgi:isopenicillin N synthase-like dioxygenase
MLQIEQAAQDLLDNGYALLTDDGQLLPQVQAAFASGREFFARPVAYKNSIAVERILEGYLALHSEFSQTKERPDLCESFAVWRRNQSLEQVRALTAAEPLHLDMTALLPTYTNIANALFEALRLKLAAAGDPVETGEVSYLQMNHYRPAEYERDLLQDPHEDGHLLTILKPTAPGAEVLLEAGFTRVAISTDQLLLMPGSLMTALTGGAIPPLVHRVRNDHSTSIRQSLMYFVNPTIERETQPWVSNDSNRDLSIRELAIRNSASFGLRSLEDAKAD